MPPRRGRDTKPRLETRIARDGPLVRQAQELRYRVFAEEMGARLGSGEARLDTDEFDAHCEHLVVRDVERRVVVGTYRILAPHAARKAGGYYAEVLFDMTQLDVLRERMVEVGRACVHPEYRSGTVMLHLWSRLARYLVDNGHDYVMGSASIPLADGGHTAASIYRSASARQMSPVDLRVVPRYRLALESLHDALTPPPPALLKGYLNLGAWICGEPAIDAHFGCADLPVLLPLARMRDRYARHFLARVEMGSG